ncbi:hypothetical protein Y032_0212g2229 [Ancylostoma ceylanicum]|uniref:Sulfotransferase domain-containing protein n=1 Tax=Ancylostoma ceylanicum TaxID=53326 RepID=A0A016SKN8_9BILA|nr:hypothetical protein Y032_0212g2229 [Ancylostoma ceylanicum]
MRILPRSFPRMFYCIIISFGAVIFIAVIYRGRNAKQDPMRTESVKVLEPQVIAINMSSIIPPFFRFREEYLVAKKYRLATCQIEKVMSTIRGGMFCYLTDSKNFTAHNRKISQEHWGNSFCKRRHIRKDLDKIYKELGQKTTVFAIVRDPFDRLISGYVDKCMKEAFYTKNSCYNCTGNFSCFVRNLHMSLQKRFALEHIKGSFYNDRHFAPQTWYCDFRNHLHDYAIIKYSPGKEDPETAAAIDELFEEAGVPSHERETIGRELPKGPTLHSTRGTGEVLRIREQLLSNEDLLKKVIEIYYHDFVVFDFPFPVLSSE